MCGLSGPVSLRVQPLNHKATKSILWPGLGHRSRCFKPIKVLTPDFHVKCSKIKFSFQIFRKFCLFGISVIDICKSSRLTIWVKYHSKYKCSWASHQFFKFKRKDTKTTSKDILVSLLFTLDRYLPKNVRRKVPNVKTSRIQVKIIEQLLNYSVMI